MSGNETDRRGTAPNEEENTGVTNVDSDNNRSLEYLNSITGDARFNSGDLDHLPDKNDDGRGAIGFNIQRGGRADPSVVALQ